MSPESIKLTVDIAGTLLIPFVLFFLGNRYMRNKEQSESAIRDAQQLGTFLEHLSSDNKERRKLALLALNHMRNADLFPKTLLQAVERMAATDDPETAAAAQLALGRARPKSDLNEESRALLFELLLPMKVHFDRSRQAFQRWITNPPNKPNTELEDAIKSSNSLIRNILLSKWYMIPAELQDDAMKLIEHYDAWSEEYVRLRPGGVRDPNVPYVFVGPKGFPFPVEAEKNFLNKYAMMTI